MRNEARNLLEMAHIEVCYANQPRLFSQKLNINDLDPSRRKLAMNAMKNGIDEAYHLGASFARVFSGKDPGDDKREEAKDIFVDSMLEICEYTRSLGDIKLHMKVFDRDIDKAFLIGTVQGRGPRWPRESASITRTSECWPICRTSPLLGEDPAEAIPLVEKFPHALPYRKLPVPRQAESHVRRFAAPFRGARRRDRHARGAGLFPSAQRAQAHRGG